MFDPAERHVALGRLEVLVADGADLAVRARQELALLHRLGESDYKILSNVTILIMGIINK